MRFWKVASLARATAKCRRPSPWSRRWASCRPPHACQVPRTCQPCLPSTCGHSFVGHSSGTKNAQPAGCLFRTHNKFQACVNLASVGAFSSDRPQCHGRIQNCGPANLCGSSAKLLVASPMADDLGTMTHEWQHTSSKWHTMLVHLNTSNLQTVHDGKS